MAIVRSLNLGQPQPFEWGDNGTSAIDRRPVAGPIQVGPLGLAGDRVSNTEFHGGERQAVYAFAREDLDYWGRELGADLHDGQFGENLTTAGIDVNGAEVGERWRVGTTLLEISWVRIPCNVFKGWIGESGFDNTAWVKRFTAVGRPGPYLRVVEAGVLAAGDEIDVVHRPGHGVTVTTMFRALTTDRTLLPELLRVDGLDVRGRKKAEEYVVSQA
jgi:MOSC domain-containing protein YiiM